MWQRVARPDVLVYLDAQLPTIARRRRIDWDETYLRLLHHRLRHARRYCDLYLSTDGLTEEEVLERVLSFLMTLAPHRDKTG